ncbi:hypothetical protein GDO81_023255 [Engystomops pustulosus]|uniref:Uncharacterized protein n=1 Tax=Engystomops pustulosus TaxID=76066 RepID=A0AAV6YL55_ENGPU|nr:hypothetical protein GDO81_023255 [Engystomops pustulosus]
MYRSVLANLWHGCQRWHLEPFLWAPRPSLQHRVCHLGLNAFSCDPIYPRKCHAQHYFKATSLAARTTGGARRCGQRWIFIGTPALGP